MVLLSSTYLLSRLAFLSLLALPSHFDGPMVIRNPGNFGPWNPESTALEFGIRNPTISKSGIQPLMESGIHSIRKGTERIILLPTSYLLYHKKIHFVIFRMEKVHMLHVMLAPWCQICTEHWYMEAYLCTLGTRRIPEER